MKKIFYGLIVTLLLVSINVYAKEVDDVWATLVQDDVLDMKGYKQEVFDEEARDFYLIELIRREFPDKEYYGEFVNCNEALTTCAFELHVGEDSIAKEVSLKWKETDNTVINKVKGYMETLKNNAADNELERPNYYLYDMDWIYYLIIGNGSDNEYKYSSMKEMINDDNFELVLQARMGDIDEFFEYGGGKAVMSYDGAITSMMDFGIGKKHVIYVPDETKDDNDAIIAAIRERISDEEVKIEAVDKRDEFKSEWTEDDYDFSKLGNVSKMADYYFKLTYKGNSYLFVVIKDTSKMIGTGEEGEPVFKLTYDFNGGSRQGESEYIDESVAVGMDIKKEIFMDSFTVTAPEGMELDAIEINGTRYELGSEYLLNKDTTFKYLWKQVATATEVEETVVENKESKVKIVFTSEELPEDIEVKVKEIGNKDKEYEEITKVLKTDNFKAFDILLESKAKGPITKLENGKFKVTVFLGKEYANKKMVAYYIKDDGTLEKYAVTMDKDGYATFETPHFSTYVFAEEKEETIPDATSTPTTTDGEEVPQTFDVVMNYVVLLVVSIIGLEIAVIFKKRFN